MAASDLLFLPPPRPPGAGWGRRFRSAALVSALGALLIALLVFVARHTERVSAETRRLVRDGKRMNCTVLDKRVSGGKSKSHYVRLVLDGPPRRPPFERRIPRGAWKTVGPGAKSVWYYEADRPEDGVSELERPSRESMAGYYASLALAGATALVIAGVLLFLGRRMGLLTTGVELMTAGIGPQARVEHEGRSVAVRIPSAPWNHVQLRSGGFVVLAAPDLSRHFFPDLRDVPLDRLAGGESRVEPLLPPVPRESTPAWAKWVRRRHSGLSWSSIVAAVAGLLALAGWAWGGGETGLGILCAAIWAGWGLLVMTGRRGVALHRALWRDGEEAHALILKRTVLKGTCHYELAFVRREEEVRFSASLSRDVRLWETPAAGEGPVAVSRAVVLVDPDRPRRCVIVPFGVG